jgi:hypothetical protein
MADEDLRSEREQWTKLLDMAEEIRSFMVAHAAELKVKE